ncbi:MAG: stage V sporulation protein AA [Blautia sp.]|nr:stage V sporulation protein AA [Blautia sp.]MDY5030457.1 stage V sporulation protein AA [Blautia sp.]
MSDTLYLKLDQNTEVTHPYVCLQDIAQLSCSSADILNRLRVMPVIRLPADRPGRYSMSAMDLIRKIQEKEPDLTITHMGEPDFIITYQAHPPQKLFLRRAKTLLVCLLSFFGGAFSIMTFNNDVDVPGLFDQIYLQVTGNSAPDFNILEISYSIGIGLGILFFFNHFGKMKFTDDPTPMQVQMRTYEDDVNNTLLKSDRRSHKEN